MIAVLAKNTLLDRVAINLAGELTLKLLQIGVDIIRQCFLENRSTQQLPLRMAGELTDLLVDAQHSAVPVDLDDACASVLICRCKPFLAGRPPTLGRRVSPI